MKIILDEKELRNICATYIRDKYPDLKDKTLYIHFGERSLSSKEKFDLDHGYRIEKINWTQAIVSTEKK